MWVTQATDQPSQQRLFHVFTRRSHGQKVRFVRYHQMLVGIEDRLHHRDRFFSSGTSRK